MGIHDNINEKIEELKTISPDGVDNYSNQQFAVEETVIEEEHNKKIKAIQKNIIIFGGVGTLITLLSFGLYIIPQYFVFNQVKADILSTEKSIDTLMLEKVTNEDVLKQLRIQEEELKQKFGDIFPIILPEVKSDSEYQEAINRLAVFFEDFALYYNKGNSPLELPSIDFGKPKESSDGSMFILPIQMTIKASDKNFRIFINQINKRSGSLDEKDFYLSSFTKKKEPIPIMSIDSLNISLPKEEQKKFSSLQKYNKKKETETLSFSVSLSAYFKSTEAMKSRFGTKKKKSRK